MVNKSSEIGNFALRASEDYGVRRSIYLIYRLNITEAPSENNPIEIVSRAADEHMKNQTDGFHCLFSNRTSINDSLSSEYFH